MKVMYKKAKKEEENAPLREKEPTEMQKAADAADISAIFFQLVLIFGPFWVIFGPFWVILGYFG